MSPLALILMLAAILIAVTTLAPLVAWLLFISGVAVQVAGVAGRARE